jgi:hypothetical protein
MDPKNDPLSSDYPPIFARDVTQVSFPSTTLTYAI